MTFSFSSSFRLHFCGYYLNLLRQWMLSFIAKNHVFLQWLIIIPLLYRQAKYVLRLSFFVCKAMELSSIYGLHVDVSPTNWNTVTDYSMWGHWKWLICESFTIITINGINFLLKEACKNFLSSSNYVMTYRMYYLEGTFPHHSRHQVYSCLVLDFTTSILIRNTFLRLIITQFCIVL